MFELDGRVYATVTPCDPPRPCLVHPRRWFPPTRTRWTQATPLWIQTHGLNLREPWPGNVLEWWVTTTGDWVGLVDVVITVDEHPRRLRSLIPAGALEEIRDQPPRR